MNHHMRIARPVGDLAASCVMYCSGLGLRLIGSFEDHDGFDGVMLGRNDMQYHFEFTRCRRHPVQPQPTPEDLLVFYMPHQIEWERACGDVQRAGFKPVVSLNPYWDVDGRTFEDLDGYRIVLQRAAWTNRETIVSA